MSRTLTISLAVTVAVYCVGRIAYARIKPAAEPAFGLRVALLLSLPMTCFYTLPVLNPMRVAFTIAVLGLVGRLADMMTSHTIKFYTANIRLSSDEVRRRREWWEHRFDRASLPDKQAPKALADYVGGFFLLAFFPVASAASLIDLNWPIFVIPMFASVAWAYRRPDEMPSFNDFFSRVVEPAFRSWICWGRWQGPDGSRTPGVFVSPSGSAKARLFATVLTLWAVAGAFVPPISSWWRNPDGQMRSLLDILFRAFAFYSLPLILLFAAFIAVGGSALGAYYLAIESPHADAIAARRDWTDWQAYTTKLSESENPIAKKSFYLGPHKEARYPILLDNSLLDVPVHIVGPTGSGKTALGVTPVICQLIARGEPVVVFDLKGDRACFEAAREEAIKAGRTFKYFTNELGHATYAFNPLSESNQEFVSFSQVVENQLEAMGLDYGQGYGKGYYASINRLKLLELVKANPSVSSYDELDRFARRVATSAKDRQECFELIARIRQLAEVQALNWRRRPGDDPVADNAIFIPDVLEKSEVVYFWLPAIGETSTVRSVACLGVNSAALATKRYTVTHGTPKRLAVFLDEAQRAASPSLLLLQQQGRANGLSLILSNQNLSDLDTKDLPGLLPSTVNNSSVHIYFSPAEPSLEDMLIEQSGHARYRLECPSLRNLNSGAAQSADKTPVVPVMTKIDKRHSRTDLKAYSSQPNVGIIQIRQNKGFSCFGGHWFAVEFGFHISKELFEARLKAPWPTLDKKTMVASRQSGLEQTDAVPSVASEPKSSSRTKERGIQIGEKNSRPLDANVSASWEARLKEAFEKRSRRSRNAG